MVHSVRENRATDFPIRTTPKPLRSVLTHGTPRRDGAVRGVCRNRWCAMNAKVKQSLALMDEAIELHKPRAVLALFSGGHDSLTATHIAAQHPRFTAAVHINMCVGFGKKYEDT